MKTFPLTAFAASQKARDSSQLAVVALGLAVPCLWLLLHYQLSVLFFVLLAGTFCMAWQFSKTAALLALFSYLFLIGDIRRISALLTGPVRLDPLLIVAPIVAGLIAVPIFLRLRVTNAFSKTVLALTIVFTLAIVNPRQGSILVGLSGAVYYLVPMFWFWIARAYATERMLFLILFRAVVPLGVVAAMLGLYQTYVGFLPWEEAWIQRALATGLSALNLGNGHIRAFGFSIAGAEYGMILVLASVCVVAAISRGRYAYSLLLPVLLFALILASSRSSILKLLLGALAIWALRSRNVWSWLPRITVGAIVGVGLLIYAGRQSADSSNGAPKGTAAQVATSHVTGGFAHPLDPRHSTLGVHTNAFLGGIASGFVNPLGSGLGSVTIAGGKFGSDNGPAGSSEVDVSDVFITTGFIGGFLYIFTIGMGLFFSGRMVLARPDTLSFALVGVLCSMLQSWTPLSSYAVGPLVWFCLGFLAQDRPAFQDA